MRKVKNKQSQPIPNGSSNRPFGVTIIANPVVHDRDGRAVEYKQALVDKSRYHEQLEEENFLTSPNNPDPDPDPVQLDSFVVDESTIRYWSDFNRVDYHPWSIQKLPDLSDWDSGMGDWVAGKETFDKCNNQASRSLECVAVMPYPLFQDGESLMDDSVRLFVEECDSLQVLLFCIPFELVPLIYTKEPGIASIYGSSNIRVVLPLFPLRL